MNYDSLAAQIDDDGGSIDDAAAIDAQPPADLLLWWKLDDDPEDGVTDSSRYARDGACTGAGCPVLATGRLGRAYRFDGTAYLQVVDPGLDVDQPFTVACWVMVPPFGQDGSFMGKVVGADSKNSWKLLMYGSDVALETSTGSAGDLRVAAPFAANEWVHVAGSWDGSIKTLYVNGSFLASQAEPSSQFDSGGVFVGSDENGGSPTHDYTGLIDDVRVYGRALKEAEVAEIVLEADL